MTSTVDKIAPPALWIPDIVRDFYRGVWDSEKPTGRLSSEFRAIERLVTRLDLKALWKQLEENLTEQDMINLCIEIAFSQHYWRVRKQKTSIECELVLLKRAENTVAKLESKSSPLADYLNSLAERWKIELHEAAKFSSPKSTKHEERNFLIWRLTGYFLDKFGKTPYANIAGIVTAVTDETVMADEVRKIVLLHSDQYPPDDAQYNGESKNTNGPSTEQ